MKKIVFSLLILTLVACQAQENKKSIKMDMKNEDKLNLSDEEWKKRLTEEEYFVLRKNGTERPFTNEFNKHYEKGVYMCAGCKNPLFKSETKYDSGSGWPAFYEAIDKSKIREIKDTTHGMYRVEVRCVKCDGHLGHVFEDGPKDKTGLRYCINSVSLDFQKE